MLSKNAICLYCCVAKNSKESEWVAQEIGMATSESKTIIPVVFKKQLELPAFIKNTKYLPAYEDPEETLQWTSTKGL